MRELEERADDERPDDERPDDERPDDERPDVELRPRELRELVELRPRDAVELRLRELVLLRRALVLFEPLERLLEEVRAPFELRLEPLREPEPERLLVDPLPLRDRLWVWAMLVALLFGSYLCQDNYP